MPIHQAIDPAGIVEGAFIGLGLILLAVGFIRSLLLICAPNEVLIRSGVGAGKAADGRFRGFVPIIGGRGWRLPLVQRVDKMSLTLMEVPVAVRNAYSKGGIAMNLDAIANVKVSSDETVIANAVERFLGRDVAEIRRVAKETLEGHLRGVIATLTPEQVNEDRLSFTESLTRESEADLRKLGLHLDTLKISHVADELGYLSATGRKAIANIIREAEIAESDAKRTAEQAEAENTGRGNVTKANAEANIAKMRNELRKVQAEYTAKVNSEEERTTAAARQARATAEQELQRIRAELEGIRLEVDQVIPADAARQAEELRARGRAAITRERGQAASAALDQVYQAWQTAGPSALQISLIEELEKLLAAAASGVHKVHVDGLSVIDSGDGKTLPNYVAAYPAMLDSVFDAVKQTTGIDIPGTVAGKEAK